MLAGTGVNLTGSIKHQDKFFLVAFQSSLKALTNHSKGELMARPSAPRHAGPRSLRTALKETLVKFDTYSEMEAG